MTTLKIGDPVTICLGLLAIRYGVVEDDEGAYYVDGETFTFKPASTPLRGEHVWQRASS